MQKTPSGSFFTGKTIFVPALLTAIKRGMAELSKILYLHIASEGVMFFRDFKECIDESMMVG